MVDAFGNKQCQGLWIPAFAGTTRGENYRASIK
jgi:hypothetical protein